MRDNASLLQDTDRLGYSTTLAYNGQTTNYTYDENPRRETLLLIKQLNRLVMLP